MPVIRIEVPEGTPQDAKRRIREGTKHAVKKTHSKSAVNKTQHPQLEVNRMKTLKTIMIPILCGAFGLASAQQGSFQTKSLTPETALVAAKAALESCRSSGFQVAVAVVDRSGLVQVLLRDRFAGAHTVEVSANKAWTAASFRNSTSALAEETQPGKAMSGIRSLPRFLGAGGGLLIEGGGSNFGAIGVSGAPGGEADEACAKAGLKAIADAIEF